MGASLTFGQHDRIGEAFVWLLSLETSKIGISLKIDLLYPSGMMAYDSATELILHNIW